MIPFTSSMGEKKTFVFIQLNATTVNKNPFPIVLSFQYYCCDLQCECIVMEKRAVCQIIPSALVRTHSLAYGCVS